jgi:lysophospholipase L1-like esterase
MSNQYPILPLMGLQPYNRYQRTSFDNSLTDLQKLNHIAAYLNDVITQLNGLTTLENVHSDDINELRNLIEKLQQDLENVVIPEGLETILNEWFDNGKLSNIIGDVLNKKLLYKPLQTQLLNEFYRKVRNGENFKIICRGDSLTYGYDITSVDRRPASTSLTDNGTTHIREIAGITYPESLQKYMNIVYPSRATVINQGYSGDTTESSYPKWFNDHGGDVTVIMLGSNDASNNEGIEDYLYWYRLIIEKELNIGSAVILLTPPRRLSPNVNDDSYGNAVFQLGEEYGCPVVDMTELTANMEADSYSDGTHFNSKGYEFIGARLMSIFIGEGLVNPFILNGSKTLSGNRTTNSLEIIGNVSYASSTGYPTADESTDGSGTGLVFATGGKTIYSFYADEDDLLIYPSIYFPVAGANVTFKLDFGLPSQSVNSTYMFDQVASSFERSVPTEINYLKENDFNWRLDTSDGFYINGVTKLSDKKIHIPKRGWHTLLIESDTVRVHSLDAIGYRDMRDMVNTNQAYYPKAISLPLLNGWTNNEESKPPRLTVLNGIAYLEAWVTKAPKDLTVMMNLPVAPYFPSNFKVTNGGTATASTIDPTLRVQMNGDVLLNHIGNTVNDVLVINISFPIYYKFGSV